MKENGVWMTYLQAKQKGEEKENCFLVPFGKSVCFASYVVKYLELLQECHPDGEDDQPLFLRATKSGLGKQPMGQNHVGHICKKVAAELGLDKPHTYTGHSFRRSSATQAANRGATSVMMKGQYGWVHEGTALKYIDVTDERPIKMAELLTEEKLTVSTSSASTRESFSGQKESTATPVPKEKVPSGPGMSDNSVDALTARFSSALCLAGLSESSKPDQTQNLAIALGALGAMGKPVTVTMDADSGEKISIHVSGGNFKLSNY